MNIFLRNQQNSIRSFEMGNDVSWVCRYEFYLWVVRIVEVVEQICIDDPKNQGFAKKKSQTVTDANPNSAWHLMVHLLWCTCLG